MRLHTNLTYAQVYGALSKAQNDGHVTRDVRFIGFASHKSRTHPRAFEVQLGTEDKYSLPAGYVDQNGYHLKSRRWKNSGSRGAQTEWATGCDEWAATWHEWGWFMAEIFAADPDARFGSVKGWHYAGAADFNTKTGGQFTGQDMSFPKGYSV